MGWSEGGDGSWKEESQELGGGGKENLLKS